MKKITSFLSGAVLIGLLTLTPGPASALVFDLNTIIAGNTLLPFSSFGTIAIEDNGMNNVDITVNLVGEGTLKVLSFYLNYDDEIFSNSSNFNFLNGINVSVNENGQKAGGYSLGSFDLKIPQAPPGNLGFEPFSGVLSGNGGNLNAEHFNFLDTSGMLYAAVHIGSIDSDSHDGTSLWVGAGKDGATPPPVPEPSTILLLGGGLLGLAIYGRKRMKS